MEAPRKDPLALRVLVGNLLDAQAAENKILRQRREAQGTVPTWGAPGFSQITNSELLAVTELSRAAAFRRRLSGPRLALLDGVQHPPFGQRDARNELRRRMVAAGAADVEQTPTDHQVHAWVEAGVARFTELAADLAAAESAREEAYAARVKFDAVADGPSSTTELDGAPLPAPLANTDRPVKSDPGLVL